MSEVLLFLVNGSYSLVSFVVALSIIVFIHEFGHYIVGRWCGIHAEVFSIGFGPVLLSRKDKFCLLYTSPSPRDRTRSRMPSSA